MAGKWLEIAQKMAEAARAGLAIERKRLNEILAERQRNQVPSPSQPFPLSPPTLTFVAGANGSGKTTLTRWNSELFREIPVLDPDTFGKTLQSTATAAFPIAGAASLEVRTRTLEEG
jgi:hypothetical protein